jgi:hypothetical protein
MRIESIMNPMELKALQLSPGHSGVGVGAPRVICAFTGAMIAQTQSTHQSYHFGIFGDLAGNATNAKGSLVTEHTSTTSALTPTPGCTDDSWITTSTTNAPTARAEFRAVWSGNEMVIWGGITIRKGD